MKRSPLPPRTKPIPRGKAPKRGGKIKPKKRSASEFARVYGSAERVEWIKSQRCIGCRNPATDGHHIATGGMGRKAHHSTIVPTCHVCHLYIHNHGARAFEAMYRITLAVAAESTHRAWYLHAHGHPFHDAPE